MPFTYMTDLERRRIYAWRQEGIENNAFTLIGPPVHPCTRCGPFGRHRASVILATSGCPVWLLVAYRFQSPVLETLLKAR